MTLSDVLSSSISPMMRTHLSSEFQGNSSLLPIPLLTDLYCETYHTLDRKLLEKAKQIFKTLTLSNDECRIIELCTCKQIYEKVMFGMSKDEDALQHHHFMMFLCEKQQVIQCSCQEISY